MKAPNILCFVMDQLRADHLACYGNPDVKTPNIDRLAREGVRCDQSFVANPVCMPNRASMFTGQYPQAHGLRYNGFTLPPSRVTLPEVLRQNGYQTASIGKIHISAGPHEISNPELKDPIQLYEKKQYSQENDSMPLPYYGLEHVYLVDGHGDYAYGHYKNELDREYPGMSEKLLPENASYTPAEDLQDFKHGCWEQSIPVEHHYNTVIADKTIDYLENRDSEKPFFLWCSFPDPHHPYTTPDPYSRMYDPAKIHYAPKIRDGELDDLPPYMREMVEGSSEVMPWSYQDSEENFRTMFAYTYGMISFVDDCIGRIMTQLEQTGLAEDTIVVFLSDHGDLLADHGLNQKGPYLFESLVKVPTIWRCPQQIRGGESSSAVLSSVDLCPTLLDFAGVAAPGCVQRRSYRPVLSDGEAGHREWAYVEFDNPAYTSQRQIRSQEWAMTYDLRGETGLLFDLKNDPDELYNLWNHPDYAEKKQELLLLLLKQSSAASDNWEDRRFGWREFV
ncbi:sulfatase-like hydrolase/transferase [Coraliomargarita algicola]|uniref:Sulfatase-like hydrolase/transferase n=1 Tax=Coraliomargarita algicola TaxID=3092156 RepID=A0ABZ0RMQ5_9BACT|nr:sulfatase-like hydrolase/transferase [Coraliomargarita sp. J2-16]WPJ96708.1 sulfatase-like hydrolase/transferase [Coraliomargarita sp. J2-16]